jgi:hypothetical protein
MELGAIAGHRVQAAPALDAPRESVVRRPATQFLVLSSAEDGHLFIDNCAAIN